MIPTPYIPPGGGASVTVTDYTATGYSVTLASPLAATESIWWSFSAIPPVKQSITGSRATDAWRTSLMSALVALGLVTDGTSA